MKLADSEIATLSNELKCYYFGQRFLPSGFRGYTDDPLWNAGAHKCLHCGVEYKNENGKNIFVAHVTLSFDDFLDTVSFISQWTDDEIRSLLKPNEWDNDDIEKMSDTEILYELVDRLIALRQAKDDVTIWKANNGVEVNPEPDFPSEEYMNLKIDEDEKWLRVREIVRHVKGDKNLWIC